MSNESARPVTGRSRARSTATMTALAAVVIAVLAGCLAPDQFDPTGNAPIGRLDVVQAAGSSLRVRGWAIDPNTKAPVNVTVAYLGKNGKHLANLPRADVAIAHPGYGAAHGFDVTTPSLGTGIGQVCVWIENVGAGTQDRALGCRDVPLKPDDAAGRFDSLTAVNSTKIRATGWGADYQTASSVNVTYSLNGAKAVPVLANVPRPDVNRVLGIDGHHGFSFDIVVPAGSHTLCVIVPGIGRGKPSNLGCRTVTVESVAPVADGDSVKGLRRVGAPNGHPLAQADRDGGVSTVLSDGSVLWLFGDTTMWTSSGVVRSFTNNTAAWAPASAPTVTTDAVAPGSVPYQFVRPTKAFSQPCPNGWASVMWPLSAVTAPIGPTTDRVVAFFGNVCLGGSAKIQSRGVAVVEWLYNKSSPPSGVPIMGRVITQELFPVGQEYGTAAYFDGDFINAYQCGRPADNGQIHWPSDPGFGPCTVARVAPSDVGFPGKWTYWSGDDNWSSTRSSARAMTIPGAGTDKQMPVSSFSIVKDPKHGFAMVYSPWPGFTWDVFVRRAPSLTGPWSPRELSRLPGCNDSAGGHDKYCYAATAQPALSTPGRLGIGYFDQLIALKPARGSYLGGTLGLAGGLQG